MSGTFTLDQAWLAAPIEGHTLTVSQLADLLRLCLDGAPVAGWDDPHDLLSRLHLAAMNEVRRAQGRADYLERAGAVARKQAAAAWRIVFDAHKRLTIRTADLRAALEGERA